MERKKEGGRDRGREKEEREEREKREGREGKRERRTVSRNKTTVNLLKSSCIYSTTLYSKHVMSLS